MGLIVINCLCMNDAEFVQHKKDMDELAAEKHMHLEHQGEGFNYPVIVLTLWFTSGHRTI